MLQDDNNTVLLTKKIKEKAAAIGFDLAGIASAQPLEETRKILTSRKLARFINKDIDLLTTPTLHLSGCKTIIALAISYASSIYPTKQESYIAQYTRGQDYHQVMKIMLEKLMTYIKGIRPDASMKAKIDSADLLERAIAQRAGLGWIGKNNILINPEFGSYLFLGVVLTNLELKIDNPLDDRCKNCNLCLQSCPADALKAHQLDPDKCISYLTQKKGVLTENERKTIGNMLWGCDHCQLVCPYNFNVPTDLHPEFQAVLEGDNEKILNFNNKQVDREWQQSALFWRGLRILQRNTLINIANSGNNDYIPLLLDKLHDNSPILRSYAAWALAKIDFNKYKDVLREHYLSDKDPIVLEELEKIFSENN